MLDLFRYSAPKVREKDIQSLIRAWEILEDGSVMGNNRVFEFVLEVELPPTLFLSDHGHMALAEMLTQAISVATPEGERTRIIHRALPIKHGIVETYKDGITTDQPELRLLALSRASTMENFLKTDAVREFKVFITSTCSIYKKVGKNALERNRLPEVLEDIAEQREIFQSTLRAFGVKSRALAAQETFELMWKYLNPHLIHAEPPTYKMPHQRVHKYITAEESAQIPGGLAMESTRSQLVTTTINNSAGTYLKIGDQFVTTLCMRKLPDGSVLGSSNALFTPKGSCYIITDIIRPKQNKTVKSVISQAKQIIGNAKGSAMKDEVVTRQRQAVNRVESGEAQVVQVGVTVVVIADDLETLKEHKTKVFSQFNKMIGIKVDCDDPDTIVRWRAGIPCNSLALTHMLTTFDDTAVNLIPTAGSFRGSKIPRTIALNRFGELVGYDAFDPNAGGRHQLVIGATGKGKSYGLQAIEMDNLKSGSQLIVVDYGNSYDHLVKAAGGSVIVLDPESDAINAFDLEEGEIRPSKAKLLWLRDFIVTLLESEVTSIEKAIIEAALEQTYQNAVQRRGDEEWLETVRLSDFASQLSTMSYVGTEALRERKSLAIELSLRLQPFINGALSGFLNSPTTVKLNAKAVSFETEPLRKNPALKPIALMLMTELIERRLNTNTSGADITVLFEEFGELMETPELVSTARMLFATSRKKGGRIIAVNQTVSVFEKDIALGILANIHHFLVFQIAPEQQLSLQKQLGLPDAVIRTIQSLTGDPGVYSEVLAFYKAHDNNFIGDVLCLRVSRLEHWTYTSHNSEKPVRKEAIELCQQAGNPEFKGIWGLAYPGTQYPQLQTRGFV
jgi:hypothetical protein